MWCVQCQNHLSECTCPDLKERLDKISNHPNIFIAPEALEQYRQQANRNDWPETIIEPES